jgi:multiple sugar transport system ATP-binding protein
MLRLLAGLEQVSSGDIYIGGRRVNDLQPKDRDVSMVFQSYALYPHMSVFDNMAFGLRLHNVGKADTQRRVQDASRLLGIDHLLGRKPRQLSGGERQRVALGRAIVREPKAFLLDEPLSNLDAQLRVQTRAELLRLHERLATTFVYVTHDQVEAMTMASRIAVMRQGTLQQIGTPRELYETPANLFVGGFIGSPAMNFFEARIEREREALWLAFDDLRLLLPPHRFVAGDGSTVIAGLRPVDIYDPAFPRGDAEPALLEAMVELIETTGSDTYLHITAGTHHFVARVDSRTSAKTGEGLQLAFNTQHLHLFDRESGVALRKGTV